MGKTLNITKTNEKLDVWLNMVRNKLRLDAQSMKLYSRLVSRMNKLNDAIKVFYKKDPATGLCCEFDHNGQRDLMNVYADAFQAVESLRNYHDQKNDAFSENAEAIMKLLVQDMNAINAISPDQGKSLPEILAGARTFRIFSSKINDNAVGDASSTRYPVKFTVDGKDVRGYFTPETKVTGFSPNRGKKIVQKCIKESEEFRKIVDPEALRHTFALFENMSGKYYLNKESAVDFVGNKFDTGIAIKEYTGSLKESPEEKERLRRKLRDLFLKLEDYSDEWVTYMKSCEQAARLSSEGLLYAEEGSTIPGRNTAMSRMSSLLGLKGIIAESYPMEQSDSNGNIMKGVFMEEAEGKDLPNFTDEDVENLDKEAPFSAACIKQAADLQILDYICQNVDRHRQNMLYKFSKDGKKIDGIQGIDNDFSFGTRKTEDNQYLTAHDASLDGLQVISTGLKKCLLSLTPDIVRFSLLDTGLKEKEIEAVIFRLKRVQNAVLADKIRTVADDQWDKESVEDLRTPAGSIFNTLHEAKPYVAHPEFNERRGKWQYKEVKVLTGFDSASLLINYRNAKEITDRIHRSQKRIWGSGSSSFSRIRKFARAYRDDNLDLSRSRHPSLEKEKELLKDLNKMKEAAEQYLKEKGNNSDNEKTRERIQIARDVLKFAEVKTKEFMESFAQQHADAEVKKMSQTRQAVRKSM